MRLLVQFDGGRDLDHLQERDGALLHASAARTRRGHQRQAFHRRALDRRGDPLRRSHPDRTGQEVELAGHHGDPPPEHRALAGQHRFVEAGRCRGGGQLAPVPVVGVDLEGCAVPAGERPLVQHGIA